MALWNQRNLPAPVSINSIVHSQNIQHEIRKLAATSANMLDYFSTQNKFERAAAFLTRFCNYWKLRLRNMRGFQTMRRINQTLLRVKNLKLSWDIMNFHGFLPEGSYIEREVYLPVRSNLEHLLVRLQGLAKLLIRVVYLTKEAARYHLKQLAVGFFFYQVSMFMALMSELCMLARKFCRQVVKFYNELYQALPILPVSDERWLPENYALPPNLAEWLGEEYEQEILTEADNVDLKLTDDPSIFTLLNHGDQFDEEFLVRTADAPVEKEKIFPEASLRPIPKTMLMQAMRSDTGELITSYAHFANKPETGFNTAQLAHLKSRYHIKQFLQEERKKRAQNLKEALSANVPDHVFRDFVTNITKDENRLTTGDLVRLFKKNFTEMVIESNSKSTNGCETPKRKKPSTKKEKQTK